MSALRLDVRDVEVDHLRGFDAVVHLAAISNDPVGHMDPARTFEINHLGSVRIARLAKQAGIERFIFASSCSLYGAASPDDLLTESAPFNPVTPYGESKVLAERAISELADDTFSPVFLRNATVYGYSPHLRLDLVVNDLVASAFVTGEVLIRSDGTPWRPLVHVEDVSNAILAALLAPREAIHGEAFNIGRTPENHQVRDIADLITEVLPDSRVTYAEGGGPDARCYRVDFSKATEDLPGFRPRWTVRDGADELVERLPPLRPELGRPGLAAVRPPTPDPGVAARRGRWDPIFAGYPHPIRPRPIGSVRDVASHRPGTFGDRGVRSATERIYSPCVPIPSLVPQATNGWTAKGPHVRRDGRFRLPISA